MTCGLFATVCDETLLALRSRGFARNDKLAIVLPNGPDMAAALSGAERAVLQLVARGLDNRAIAAQLGKSDKTVRNQVSSIFAKLGVRSRAEAIVRVRDSQGRG